MLSSLLRWLRPTKRLAARGHVRYSRVSRNSYIPRFECLEARTVPAVTLSNVQITPAITQNSVATLSGNLSDTNPQNTFTLVVNWGDSSPLQTFNYAAGTTTFNQTHVYAVTGAYSVTLTVGDSDHSGATVYGADTAGDLMTMNLTTGAGTLIGTLPRPDLNITEIAFNNFEQQAWLEFGTTAYLGQQFNIFTAAAIGPEITNMPGEIFPGMTFDGATLYASGITSTGGTSPSDLRILNPATGISTLIGMTGINGPLSGLAYNDQTGVLYGIRGGNVTTNNLVTVNLSTGVATTIMSTGFAAGSLTFGPDGLLYAGSNTGQLYRINLSAKTATLVGPDGFGSALSGLTLVDATAKVTASASIDVMPPPNHFGVSETVSSATAGNPMTVTVTAQDQFNNTATYYSGTVHITSSDSQAVLPADFTLTNGVGIFSATLKTAGSQTLTATDTTYGVIGTSTAIVVSPGPASHFAVGAPTTTTAGNIFVFTVTAEDAFQNTANAYTGVVHLTSNDPQAILQGDSTLNAGTGFFGALLRTAGNDTITATDMANSNITGASQAIVVLGLAATHLVITAPATAITGAPQSFTVTAKDPFNNNVPGYNGTVHFTSTDPSAVLPANTTLVNGSGTFSITLETPGPQTISAIDVNAASIAGASNSIATFGLVVTSFTPTSTGFVATFSKAVDPSVLNLYDTAGVLGAADVTLTGPGPMQPSIHGSLLIDPTDTTITFVKTSTFTNPINSFNPQTGLLTAGTYTVTFRSAANGFKDLTGMPLDGTASGSPAGSNFTTTFVVSTTPTEVVGVPGFARGPGNAVNLPNNQAGVGIPISFSDGTGVTSGKFTLQYNSALLTITGATVNSGLTGAALTLDASSTAGNAVIDFSSPVALASGPERLGGLVASVPNSAAALYKSKALLHFSSMQINGNNAIAVTGDDAVDVDAYFGDANGDGTLSAGDGSLILRVASGVDNNGALGVMGGFSAFPLADPVLIGDLNSSGAVNAGAVTLLNSYLSGTARPQIPAIPTGLTIVTTGPDPSLSLPPLPGGRGVGWGPGSTVLVPVNIDTARPAGSTGMTEAILAVRFDPAVFTVTAQDVQLGTLPLTPTPLPGSGERGRGEGSGWQLEVAINAATGEIGIDLFSSTPIQTTSGGSLVTIALQVRENAPTGQAELSLVPAVNPTGQRSFQTTVSDNQGAFVIHYATNSGQWAVGSGQSGVNDNDDIVSVLPTAVVNGNDEVASALPAGHRPLPTASVNGNDDAVSVLLTAVVNGNDEVVSVLPTANSPLSAALEQVFGESEYPSAFWLLPNDVFELGDEV